MAEAAAKCELSFSTFKRYAIIYGLYKPNQAGIGLTKKGTEKFSIEEILNGNAPHFQSYKLKTKILKNNLLDYRCDICGISEWRKKSISLELDHIDGNKHNHKINNLRLLCPNCHSQTDTFRSKNIRRKFECL